MSNYTIIKQQADQFRKARDYSKALPLYKQLWEEHRQDCNEWEGWAYALCLKQIKDYAKALELCREIYISKPDFSNIKGVYAWCIYYLEIAVDNVNNEHQFLKAGEGILKISQQDDQYSPYTLTVVKVLEYLNDKNRSSYPIDEILVWTSKLNYELLDDKPFTFTDNEGKTRELASKKEQYFMWRTKALFKKGLYQECIELCEIALNTFDRFHYDNDVWFTRRITLSNRELGNTENALSQLKEILKRKKEWFILQEIAEIYFEQGNIAEAQKYVIDACLSFGDADKKLNLFKLFAEILTATNLKEEAKKHIEFIYQIRKKNGWKIDNVLQNLLNEHQIEMEKVIDLKDFQRDLKTLWEKLKFNDQAREIGVITSFLPNGRAGFVETENKKSYFFKIDNFLSRQRWLNRGQKISFFLEDSFDQRKNRPTKNAVNIKPIY